MKWWEASDRKHGALTTFTTEAHNETRWPALDQTGAIVRFIILGIVVQEKHCLNNSAHVTLNALQIGFY